MTSIITKEFLDEKQSKNYIESVSSTDIINLVNYLMYRRSIDVVDNNMDNYMIKGNDIKPVHIVINFRKYTVHHCNSYSVLQCSISGAILCQISIGLGDCNYYTVLYNRNDHTYSSQHKYDPYKTNTTGYILEFNRVLHRKSKFKVHDTTKDRKIMTGTSLIEMTYPLDPDEKFQYCTMFGDGTYGVLQLLQNLQDKLCNYGEQKQKFFSVSIDLGLVVADIGLFEFLRDENNFKMTLDEK